MRSEGFNTPPFAAGPPGTARQWEVALRHPKMTLLANALGTPPKYMIEKIHAEGRKVAAQAGNFKGILQRMKEWFMG